MSPNHTSSRSWLLVASRGLLATAAVVSLTASAARAQVGAPPAIPPEAPTQPPAAPDLTPGGPAPDPRPDDPEFEGVAGRIVEIGDRQIVVLPNDSRQKVSFRVPEGARILLNRERATLSNLKVGDQVRVTVAARGSDRAREVVVARIAPSSRPRSTPGPRPAQPEAEGVNVEVSETRSGGGAGMGLVVTSAANGGVMVVDAQENSPADRAGLRAGDVVLSFEDDELASPQDLVSRVRERRPGEKVTLMVGRGGRAIKGDVSLARREAAPDVVIRRPLSGGQPAGATVQPEVEVSTEVPAAAAPGTTAVVPAGGATAQPAGDLQRVEQTLQLLLQEIRALRQELRGSAVAPQNQPSAPAASPTSTETTRD